MKARIAILVGLGQGLLLLLLHLAVQRDWPVMASPAFAYPAYAVVLLVPVAGMLGFRFGRAPSLALALAVLSGLMLLLGVYAGHIAFTPITIDNSFGSIFAFGSNMLLLAYITLPFMQSWLRRGRFVFLYADLYEFGWSNTLVIIVACVFTALVWALLGLWAALFAVLDVKFFFTLFSSKYFAYPATGVMFAYGISLGLQRLDVGVVRRVDFLFRALMVMVALIVALFLLALPLTGLKPLWSTGKAALLLLWLQAFIVLFANGLFQYGDHDRSEGPLVRGAMALAMLALPALSAICGYALYLRVAQYGWTVERVWATLVTAVMTLYAFGYATAAVRDLLGRDRGPAWIAPTNIVTALSILGLLVLANSPLLSPAVVAADSQVGRLLAHRVDPGRFDFKYLRFSLGRVGLQKLKQLQQLSGRADSGRIRKLAKQALALTLPWDQLPNETNDIAAAINVYPNGHRLDQGLLKVLRREQNNWPYSNCLERKGRCTLVFADMNGDGRDEALLFIPPYAYDAGWLMQQRHDRWVVVGKLYVGGNANDAVFMRGLKRKQVSVHKNAWDTLRIGKQSWVVVPEGGKQH